MQIGIIKERRLDEKRVAATPDTVKKFIAMGLKVNIKKAPASQQQSQTRNMRKPGQVSWTMQQRVPENADIVLKVNKPIDQKIKMAQSFMKQNFSNLIDIGKPHGAL